MTKRSARHRLGYTLIELMVVIAIIGILSLIAFYSLSFGDKRDASKNSVLDLRNAIRTVQEQSQTNKIEAGNATSADYYGILLACAGSGCGVQSGVGRYVADSYKIVRVEKCNSLNCANDTINCGMTVVSTTKLPTGFTITADAVTVGSSTTYPRAVMFTKGSSTPQFYAISSTNATSTLSQTNLILTVRGYTVTPTVQVFSSTGRIESTGTF